jgi:hypothetical protein
MNQYTWNGYKIAWANLFNLIRSCGILLRLLLESDIRFYEHAVDDATKESDGSREHEGDVDFNLLTTLPFEQGCICKLAI